jgi:hypothetical protein
MIDDPDVKIESAMVEGVQWWRLNYKGVVSPNLRSKDAAMVYLNNGFREFVQILSAVTDRASEAVKAVNARSDKELKEILEKMEAATILLRSSL